jgi:cystathionine beta-lyase/cystathionine gamma-synthase
MKKPTLVNHPPDVSPPPGNLPVIAPIYQSVKYEFESVDDTLRMLRGETPGYFYMRASNPTTRQLELTLAALQDRDDCLATASGVNAIAQTLIGLTKQGDTSCVSWKPTAPRATSSGDCWRDSASSTPCSPSRTWRASKTCSPHGRRAW